MDSSSRMFAPFAGIQQGNKSISIIDAIQGFVGFNEVEEVVLNNTASINNKEFYGYTPLHKAALRGEPRITQLLIFHGASIDEKNDYGETPLHFACKQGNPANIYTFLQHGADIRMTDTQGKNAMHHAAIGGSVHAMQFLSEVHGLRFDEKDFCGVTPLHLASFQGFQDAVKYLIRKERSNVHWKDNTGNLPLHMACTTGLSETCWSLLEKGGCGMLTVDNKQGKTPLDILKEGRTPGHSYLYQEMKGWVKDNKPEQPPSGPLLSWLVMLLIPSVSFLNIIGTGYLARGYSGLFITALTIVLCVYTMNQQHRLPHMSRWSNPLYAGAFAAGILHTAVLYFYKIFPVFQALYPVFTVACLCLAFIMICLYTKLLFRDPGMCTTSRSSLSVQGEYLTIDHVARGICKTDEFCVYCEIIPPERARHCKICQKCYRNHDHHCLFLLNCIAKNNHRTFLLFLMLTSLCHALFVMQCGMYILWQYPNHSTWSLFLRDVFFQQGWLNMLVMLNICSLIWELMVVLSQLLIISHGLTTTYHPGMLNKYKLTTRNKLNNICRFIQGRNTLNAWERYAPTSL